MTQDTESLSPPEASAPKTWLIAYEDVDKPIEVFTGEGAEEAARRRSEEINCAWTHWLFVEVERGC